MPPPLVERRYLNRLSAATEPTGAVVVIDVLRSFSTAAWAIHRGARELYPVAAPGDGLLLLQHLPQALLVGAVGGGAPIPGYHYGNSPSAVQGAELQGRTLIHCTAAGVRGLSRYRTAPLLFGAALLNTRATAAVILAAGVPRVTLVITGEWTDRDGDEDVACADYLEALLQGGDPSPEPFSERVRQSDFGRRFAAGDQPHLPPADLDLCAEADRFDFALQALPSPLGLRLVPVYAGGGTMGKSRS